MTAADTAVLLMGTLARRDRSSTYELLRRVADGGDDVVCGVLFSLAQIGIRELSAADGLRVTEYAVQREPGAVPIDSLPPGRRAIPRFLAASANDDQVTASALMQSLTALGHAEMTPFMAGVVDSLEQVWSQLALRYCREHGL